MELLFDVPEQGLAFFDCGGVRLYLARTEADSPKTTAAIYYTVDSVEDGYRALQDRGVVFDDEPHTVYTTHEVEGRMVFFEDSEGNTIALMAERPL
jgi:methylmalonyl-CoA/ethylmalonyl-CoA epimerase